MRDINWIVWHCSATPPTSNLRVDEIRRWHINKGWKDIGYHYVIHRDGTIGNGRPVHEIGAHVKGHNKDSIGVCLVGGLSVHGNAENNYTEAQIETARLLANVLQRMFPGASHRGHRDFSPDLDGDGVISPYERIKECPRESD